MNISFYILYLGNTSKNQLKNLKTVFGRGASPSWTPYNQSFDKGLWDVVPTRTRVCHAAPVVFPVDLTVANTSTEFNP